LTGLGARQFANLVYAWLAEGLDHAGHKRLDEALDAPLAGWDKANRSFFRNLQARAEATAEAPGGATE
jgi:hypothetical protein